MYLLGFISALCLSIPCQLCFDYLTAPDGYSWLERKRNKDRLKFNKK